jgi:hypothetical protein
MRSISDCITTPETGPFPATPLRIAVEGSGDVAALMLAPPAAAACYVFAHGAGAGMTHAFMADLSAALADRAVAHQRRRGDQRVALGQAVGHVQPRTAQRSATAASTARMRPANAGITCSSIQRRIRAPFARSRRSI